MADDLYQLACEARLLEASVFSSTKGDAILQETERYIPGSNLWGAMAYRFIEAKGIQPQVAHRNAEFRGLFLRGRLRFLHAYRVSADNATRLLPPPSSLALSKKDPGIVIDGTINDPGPQSTRPVQGFCKIEGPRLSTRGVDTRIEYHTPRDRRMGRAMPGEGPFAYECLEQGQVFRSLILGGREDLERVAELLDTGKVTLGRSRSAQYGTVELVAKDIEPFVSEIGTDADGRLDEGKQLVVTLTSHWIPWPESGATPSDPVLSLLSELAPVLGKSETELKEALRRTNVRTTVVGGYSSAWGLQRPQQSARTAGSVFVFDLSPAVAGGAERTSLGQRTAEGFGRFVLNWHRDEIKEHREDRSRDQVSRPHQEVPQSVERAVRLIASERLERIAVQEALDAAGEFWDEKVRKNVPPNSALTRLFGLFSNTDLDAALSHLGNLQDPQQDAEEYRDKPIGRTLRRFRNSNGDTFHDAVTAWRGPSLDDTLFAVQDQNIVDLDGMRRSEALVRVFAQTLLQDLLRRRRAEEGKSAPAERTSKNGNE